jgi:hypothetical protein
MTTSQRERIRALNDRLRQSRTGGMIVITPGIRAMGPEVVFDLLRAVAEFDDFSPNNDPYGEHDMGALTFRGRRVFWKIDAFDLAMEYASPDPSDPTLTKRVLTVMLAEEY